VTSIQHATESLHIACSLFGIWLLVYVLFKDYRLDVLRQRLFDLRGELFDYAAGGAIDFAHPAYGMLRTRINRLIRFAHRFTSAQLVLSLSLGRVPVDPLQDPLQEWRSALSTVDDAAVRERLLAFNRKMLAILVWHLVSGSIALFASLVLFAMCWTAKTVFQKAASALTQALSELGDDLFASYVRRFPVEQLEIQALEAGDDSELAAA
jgi:hypothetical protein